jgi:prepilin-type N-terminal cleavage/methylation domain-containing protein
MPKAAPSRAGFSLVELAMVMAVIGLMIGGVIVGKSMIRSSQLRATVSEYQRYVAAGQAFDTKYGGLPGDITNATSYWGDNASYCADGAITDGTPGTCNGDNSGSLDKASAASTTGEIFQAWNQMALAGMIEGSYSGIAGSGSTIHSIIGTNVPRSKLANSGWAIYNWGNYSGAVATLYQYNYQNTLILGGNAASSIINTARLKPEEAQSIDAKLDDGRPASGLMLVREGTAFNTATSCTTSTSSTDYDGKYNVGYGGIVCIALFHHSFN